MTRHKQDRAAVRFPPPLVFVWAVVAGFLLNRSVLPLPLGLPDWIREAVGDGAVLFGAGLMITATVLFRRTGQHPSPWKNTPEMILKGPFRVTRNPMYLGMALIQLGTGLRLSNGWILGMPAARTLRRLLGRSPPRGGLLGTQVRRPVPEIQIFGAQVALRPTESTSPQCRSYLSPRD